MAAEDHYALTGFLALPDTASAMVYDQAQSRLLVTGGRDGREYLTGFAFPSRTPVPVPPGTTAGRYGALAVAQGVVYASNQQTGLLSRFRHSGAGPLRLYLGHLPGAMALPRAGKVACVLTGCDWRPGSLDTGSALRIVSLDTFAESGMRTCPLPEKDYGEARAVAVTADGTMAFVAAASCEYGAATILAIDLATAQVRHRHTFRFPGCWVSPRSLVLSPTGEPILAIDEPTGSRLVLYSRELVPRKTIALELGPTSLAVAPDGMHALVASRGASGLRVLDLRTFEIGRAWPSPVDCPSIIAFDHTGDHAFVAGSYGNRAAVLARTPGRCPEELPPPADLHREERILYSTFDSRGTSVWAIRPDGSDRRLLFRLPGNCGSVRVSPDGTRLSYMAIPDKVNELFTYSLVTGERRRLTHVARDRRRGYRGVGYAAWLPHGRALAYTIRYDMYETEIFVVSAAGGESYPLLNNHDDLDVHPAPHPWDPDRLLFLFDAGNWSFDREFRLLERTSGRQWTVFPRNGRTHHMPVWHPNGSEIVWTQSGTTLRSHEALWTMRADGTGGRKIIPPYPGEKSQACVDVSPDGRRVLYDRRNGKETDLCIVDLRTGTETLLVGTPAEERGMGWAFIVMPAKQPE